MSHRGPDDFEQWFDENEGDLMDRYCQDNAEKFQEYCYQIFVNSRPEYEPED